MKNNPLRTSSMEIYRKSASKSWFLGIFFGFVTAAFLLLDVFLSGLSFILVPFVIAPLFFACLVMHINFLFGAQLSTKNIFKGFGLFYRNRNYGSFSIMRCLLYALIFYVSGELIFSSVSGAIVSAVDTVGYNALMDELVDYLANPTTTLALSDAAYNAYVLMSIISYVPSMLIAILVFLFFFTRNALSVYISAHTTIKQKGPNFAPTVLRYTLRKKGNGINKDFIALNWPMFVIYIVAVTGVSILCSFYLEDSLVICTISVCCFFVLVSFYLPFYFCNMEAIYAKHAQEFDNSYMEMVKQSLVDLQARIDLSQAEKERVEDMLNTMGKENNGEDPNNPENPDENAGN